MWGSIESNNPEIRYLLQPTATCYVPFSPLRLTVAISPLLVLHYPVPIRSPCSLFTEVIN